MNQFDYSGYTQGASMEASRELGGKKGMFLQDKIKDIPKFEPTAPQTGERTYVVDLIMFPAGINHPLVATNRIQPGHLVHITWAFIHRNMGPSNDRYICMARTYGKPCAACEERNRILADTGLNRDQAWELAKPYNTGTYPIGAYNVVNHLNPQQITWQESVSLWTINNSFMESKLQAVARDPMTGAFINYAWPTAGNEGGRHISFQVYKKGQYDDYKGHSFYVRQNPVPVQVLQSAMCLDDFFDVPDYDELKEIVEMMKGHPAGGQPTGEGVWAGPGPGMPGQPGPDVAAQGPVYGPGEVSMGTVADNPPLFGAPAKQCPYASHGGVLGRSFGTWQECQTCQLRVECEPAPAPIAASPSPVAMPGPTAATPGPQPVAAGPGGTAPMPRRPSR